MGEVEYVVVRHKGLTLKAFEFISGSCHDDLWGTLESLSRELNGLPVEMFPFEDTEGVRWIGLTWGFRLLEEAERTELLRKALDEMYPPEEVDGKGGNNLGGS